MNAPVTLYREVDALGGVAMSSSDYDRAYNDGYSQALDLVLAILAKRGFSELADADAPELLKAAWAALSAANELGLSSSEFPRTQLETAIASAEPLTVGEAA